MNLAVVLAGTAASVVALHYLATTDPKRRRVFHLPVARRRRAGAAWVVAVLPGVVAATVGGAGSFFVWFGAVSILGWVLAATRPGRATTFCGVVRGQSSK